MKVIEIYPSISGEVGGISQGAFVTFIRFSGCNLLCSWCDTQYSYSGGDEMTVQDIVKRVLDIGVPRVIITGGEPLIQNYHELILLLETLHENDIEIQIETNGSICTHSFDPSNNLVDSWIVDYKMSASGMSQLMLGLKAFAYLPEESWIKFVVIDQSEIEQMHSIILKIRALRIKAQLDGKLHFAVSPGPGMDGAWLIKYLIENNIFDVVVNFQLHKLVKLHEGTADKV